MDASFSESSQNFSANFYNESKPLHFLFWFRNATDTSMEINTALCRFFLVLYLYQLSAYSSKSWQTPDSAWLPNLVSPGPFPFTFTNFFFFFPLSYQSSVGFLEVSGHRFTFWPQTASFGPQVVFHILRWIILNWSGFLCKLHYFF